MGTSSLMKQGGPSVLCLCAEAISGLSYVVCNLACNYYNKRNNGHLRTADWI